MDQWLNFHFMCANRTASCPKSHNERSLVLLAKHEQGCEQKVTGSWCQSNKEGKNDNNYIYGLKMFRVLHKVSDGLFHSVSGNISKPTYLRLANASIFKA